VPSNPPPASDMGNGTTTPSANPPSSTEPAKPPASPR
jgi:hypothetical protein